VTQHDVATRADIERMVDAFYDRVRVDQQLGPIFQMAQVDWVRHLPRMYDFWESVLFGATGFKGNPLETHRQLAQRTPLTGLDFERWLELFDRSVDSLFSGPMAEEAKQRASRIAVIMATRIHADQISPGSSPARGRLCLSPNPEDTRGEHR
jgi:hemoglobin